MAGSSAGNGKQDSILDFSSTAEQELQFQNFVLSDNSGPSRGQAAYAFTATQANASAESSNASFWNIEYYQQWFDVDSDQVLKRISATFAPRGSFLELVENNLELYGPFWIPTTVIFALFVTTSIANNIVSYIGGQPLEYDFTLLSFATTTCYLYAFLVPLIVWVLCRWLSAPAQLLELVMIYGYGMFIWIPVSVLSIIPSETFRWVLIVLAFVFSAAFMLRNAHAITSRSEDKRATTFVLSFIALAQFSLAVLFKVVFFRFVVLHSGAPPDDGQPDEPAPSPPPAPGNDTNSTFLFM
ncbi:hypothetical protein DFJ74DRAFT_698018 [Hyaloraphidium curvatum]|nr:hypothetical protein DFJ74DRAFT_698018 [Hyaloraphidium curvatum]